MMTARLSCLAVCVLAMYAKEASGAPCNDSNYENFGTSSCYRLRTDTLDFNDAETACLNDGGGLVDIHSAAESNIVQNMTTDRDVWMGLLNHFDVFEWTSDKVVNYTNWAPGQPDDGMSTMENHCGYFSTNDGAKWAMRVCHDHLPYICEKEN